MDTKEQMKTRTAPPSQTPAPRAELDPMDQALADSFPASDPPAQLDPALVRKPRAHDTQKK